jgi:hypothetical protein
MPLYNTATVATAVGASPKWLDNLLSHNKIDGVSGGRQGVQRRLSADAVRIVALAKELIEHAALSAPAAVGIAAALVASTVPGGGTGSRQPVQLSPSVWIELDLGALEREISAGLAHAVEVTPHPRRGRPRRAKEGST